MSTITIIGVLVVLAIVVLFSAYSCIVHVLDDREVSRRIQAGIREACIEEALERQHRQDLEQQQLELQLRSMIADINRLGQVMRGTELHDTQVPERFRSLEELRLAQDRITLMLYTMALNHRVTASEVSVVSVDNQRLWSQYYAIAAQ